MVLPREEMVDLVEKVPMEALEATGRLVVMEEMVPLAVMEDREEKKELVESAECHSIRVLLLLSLVMLQLQAVDMEALVERVAMEGSAESEMSTERPEIMVMMASPASILQLILMEREEVAVPEETIH